MNSPNSDKYPDQDNNPEISIQKQDSSMQVTPTECMAELDAVLASVIRVFATRGRAIREERAKQQSLKPEPGGEHQSSLDEIYQADESATGPEA